TGLNFIFIPASSYQVGLVDNLARFVISPQLSVKHFPESQVELSSFWIATDLFRLSHWQQLHQSSFASYFKNFASPKYEENWVRDIRWGHDYGFKLFSKDRIEKDPAITLTFQESRALSQNLGVRLPSWVEWEVAARGTESYLFPWGNTFDLSRVQLSYLPYNYTWEDSKSIRGIWRETEDISGHYCRIDDFGEYANMASPFGMKGLMYWGLEWNAIDPDDPIVKKMPETEEYSEVMRSILDCGFNRTLAYKSELETENNALSRSNHRAFSGVPLAGFSSPATCGKLAAFRLVYPADKSSKIISQ
ncbi:MAG: SUMF1/EgtB/PvdO family nonheme iron enzyme, partial [Cyanobacteria bacterium P01_E01_bin.42]